MALLKCKMCGGNLEVTSGMTVAECEYCGTTQTLPSSKDEGIQNLFNRANNLRLKCDFDKAEQLYEKILQNDDTEAEAHWGIVLCKYGIEYVEDPKTFKRIPTCHRASYEAVTTDADYLAAIQHADTTQKAVYEAEAKAIEEIQKNILSIVKNERPYDVFLCYKETDENGKRTIDSAIANDIYYQLTQEGLKVFYAAITLEDKLGQEYEPYIFAALNSAKVMLVIGTKEQYFSAVWVKNEWSRFMQLMKKDRNKLLIPCYKDMDAYDLPEEFAHLQAQDMSKIGFINDVVRGIKKVVVKEEPKVVVEKVKKVSSGDARVASLLKRVFIFLEDEEWDSADEYCEKVLDIDPENAQAYLGQLLAMCEVTEVNELIECEESFDEYSAYQKIMRYGDEKLKNTLRDCAQLVNERIKKNDTYEKALDLMKSASYERAAELFDTIETYKDAKELSSQCHEKANNLHKKFAEIIEKYQVKSYQVSIAAGGHHTVGLTLDGTVIATGKNYRGQCNVSNWSNIVSIAAGGSHTVGLKSDGTVIATGSNEYGQCNVSAWSNIVSIVATSGHTVGLKSDGTVIATGDNKKGQCNVSDWSNVVIIAANFQTTVGLKSDGTVITTKIGEELDWSNIVSIATSSGGILGLKSDGTVVARHSRLKVSDWSNIVEIAIGMCHAVGLKSDGTVVATGVSSAGQKINEYGQCNVSNWSNIVSIAACDNHTVGLKSDGTVIATGKNTDGECDVSYWRKMYIPIVKETKLEYEMERKRITEERIAEERRVAMEQQLRENRRSHGFCQHCGGKFQGLFSKVCSKCGKKKDY